MAGMLQPLAPQAGLPGLARPRPLAPAAPLPPLPPSDGLLVLRFASAFLWADLRLDDAEHAFFHGLARELGVHGSAEVGPLLAAPPSADEVDPTRVSPALAARVRDAALRAIASDGVVEEREMALFDLLDELLPRQEPARAAATSRRTDGAAP